MPVRLVRVVRGRNDHVRFAQAVARLLAQARFRVRARRRQHRRRHFLLDDDRRLQHFHVRRRLLRPLMFDDRLDRVRRVVMGRLLQQPHDGRRIRLREHCRFTWRGVAYRRSRGDGHLRRIREPMFSGQAARAIVHQGQTGGAGHFVAELVRVAVQG